MQPFDTGAKSGAWVVLGVGLVQGSAFGSKEILWWGDKQNDAPSAKINNYRMQSKI